MSRINTMKLTFPQKEQCSSFDHFNFFLCEDCRDIQKFTDLAQLLTLIKIEFPQLNFLKLCFRAKYILFHVQKIKVKNFIVVVTLLNLVFVFHFFPLFNVFLVSLAMWRIFMIFLGGSHLFGDSFFIFKENTFQHLKEPLQATSTSNNEF